MPREPDQSPVKNTQIPNTMKSNFTITAVLTTMSPLHITEPGDVRVDINGKDVKGDAGFPCPRMTKMWLATQPHLSAIAGHVEDGAAPIATHVPVPCVPANTLRGALRRMAARSIQELIVSRGEKLSIGAYNVLQCGAASGAPDGSNPSVAEVQAASSHPYFGLFGGGPRLLRSNLRVDTGLAVTEASVPYLRPEFASAVNGRQILSIGWRRRNDDAMMLTDIEHQATVVADFHAAINGHQDAGAQAKAAKAKPKDEKASAEVETDAAQRGIGAFNALEYVVPGTHFALRFDIDGTEAQAGLLLDALLRLLKKNRLGGDGRRGFGRFCLQSVMITENGERHSVATRMTEDSVEWEGRAAQLMAAWEAAKPAITAGEIEEFAKPAKKPAPDKKKGKDKSGDGESGAPARDDEASA